MALDNFCKDGGIPKKLASNQAPELCGRKSDFFLNAKNKGIDIIHAEPERNDKIWKVDLEIRELKKRTHDKMIPKRVPTMP